MFERIRQFVASRRRKNGSIVMSLFFSYQLIFTLPLLLVVLLNYYSVSGQAVEQAHETYTKTLEQTASYVGYKANAIRNIMEIISYDANIQDVITLSEAYYRQNSGNWFVHTADVKSIIFNTYSTSDISLVRLYMNEGIASIEETEEFQRMSSAEQTDWYRRLNEPDSPSWQWFPSTFFRDQYQEEHVSFIKKIPSLHTVNRFVGIIKADVPQRVFLDILDQGALTPGTSMLLFNSHDEVIASLGEWAEDGQTLVDGLAAEGMVGDARVQRTQLGGEAYLAGYRPITDTDWTLIMLVSYRDILASEVRTRNQMISIVLILMLVAIPLTYGMSRRFTRRIRLLTDSMHRFAGGETQIARMVDDGNDEVSLLVENFNQMMDDIQVLMEQEYEQGKAIQALELRVLQAQINPHFLYNTLDMIRWMAMRIHADDIATATTNMAAFYKLSLGHGEETATLEQEIEHITRYVQLQNMRFKNGLHLAIDVPEPLLSRCMLKIILQPLVENSILHGILEKDVPEGTIRIGASEEDGVLTITVSDDGVGMPPEMTEDILRKSARRDGYGVKNIHKRLRISYGEEYGLSYESEPGKGTTVYIRIPVVVWREGMGM